MSDRTTVTHPNGTSYALDDRGWIIPQSAGEAQRFADGCVDRAAGLAAEANALRDAADVLDAEAERLLARANKLGREWGL